MLPIDLLAKQIKLLESPGFLSDRAQEKEVETACVTYLKSLGYKVAKVPTSFKIKNLDELIDFFYNLMNYYHNEVCSLVSNRQKDKALFSRFVTSRQGELECSFSDGLQDCATIINALFAYESELGLTLPIGTWIFGSDKCKWLTDKVINMLNSNQDIINEFKVTQLVDNDERNSEEYKGFNFEHLRSLYGK